MPYRIDVPCSTTEVVDFLIESGALDLELVRDGLAAIMPDAVTKESLLAALRVPGVKVSPVSGRDDGSIWILSPPPIRVGPVVIAAPEASAPQDALRLGDTLAFGSGHHPTTAMCLQALEEIVSREAVDRVLDVGTGSGILALTALRLGVPHAVAIDTDGGAVTVAAANARLNHLADRLHLVHGGPEAIKGTWPLILANVLPAPLMEMAPNLVRQLGSGGVLILSGIPAGLEPEVRRSYQHFGLRHVESRMRNGWTMLIAQASW